MNRTGPHRRTEYRLIMTVICLVCGLAAFGSVAPLVEHMTNLVLLTAAGVIVLLAGLRVAVRFVREWLEDRADTRTAAAWRAEHRAVSQVVA